MANDSDKAARALATAGISYTEREVLIVKVLDEPGMLGDLALVMSEAGINIDSVYVTTRGHVVAWTIWPAPPRSQAAWR